MNEAEYAVRYGAGMTGMTFAWFTSMTDAQDFAALVRKQEPDIPFEIVRLSDGEVIG